MLSKMIPSMAFGSCIALLYSWLSGARDLSLARVGYSTVRTGLPRRRKRLRVSGTLAAVLLTVALLWPGKGFQRLAVSLCGLALCSVRYVLSTLQKRRRLEDASAQWPVMLESMAVAALAGSDLRTAFQTAAKRTTGHFRQDMERVILRLTGGMTLSQAFAGIPSTALPIGSRFLSTITSAEILGTPIAPVLNELAEEALSLQRQEFEARYNALGVKLSVITVVFLLPPVLIVSVAPHLLAFLKAAW